MKLKREGKSEGEIIATLRAQGVNPMQISEALNQSKIKEAVYDSNPTEGMTPSMMQTDENERTNSAASPVPSPQDTYTPQQAAPTPAQNYSPADNYAPAPQDTYTPQYPQSYSQNTYSQNSYPQDNYYPEQPQYANPEMPEEQYYDGNTYASSTDTIIEVAEQVFAEKMKKISKEMKELTEFKTIFGTKVENLTHRLERMEKQFDKMQLAILEKVGEYGKGLDYLRKELNMVEDTVSKFSKK
jgi:hypothetical protein